MIYKLAYGKTGHTIEIPDHYNIDLIEPKWTGGIEDPFQAIIHSLRNPFQSQALSSIVSSHHKVAIIFSDITRATPYHIIIPALLNELSHIPAANIKFFCANGTHRPATNEELVQILGSKIVKDYSIIQNVANDQSFHNYLGTTSSGNKIILNNEVLECDYKILTGFIEPHFFAGFSGGAKALIPGMAYLDTIKFNHSISHLSHPNSTWGITTGNPIWEEIMEAAKFVPGLFLLNIAMNRNKEITAVFSGNLGTAHKAGCIYVKESAMAAVDNPYDIVVTSNSGFPLDLNIYQSVKGMSAAAQIVKPGGHIIIAAECWDGIPSGSDYESILSSVNTPVNLMEFIKEKETDLKDTWQVYWQAVVQQKANVYLYSDKLSDQITRKALLNPVDHIPRLIHKLASITGPDTSICIMPEGPQTIPYIKYKS